MKQDILGIRYDNLTLSEALERALTVLQSDPKASIYFLNLDCLRQAHEDADYRAILERAALVLPDGVGLKLATRLFGGRMRENCNGSEFSPLLMEAAAARGLTVYLFGAKEGIAKRAADNLVKRYPGLRIAGTHSGYFEDEEKVIGAINEASPDLLFVAMGVPRQEKWIAKHRARLRARLCLGVGAFFDYASGQVPRAPRLFIKMNLEWFWRIFTEPRRLFKRYVIHGIPFALYLHWIRFSGRKS